METLGGYGSSSDDSDGEQPQTKVENRFFFTLASI